MSSGVKLLISGAVVFALSCFIPLVGIIGFVLGGSSTQFQVPGRKQIRLESAGSYMLYNDYITTFNDKNYRAEKQLPDGMSIEILNSSDRQTIDFKYDSSVSTSSMGNKSNSVGSFEIKEPCEIEIEVSGLAKERVFSVSKFKLVRILVIIGMAVMLSAIGVVLFIIGLVKVINSQLTRKTEDKTPTAV